MAIKHMRELCLLGSISRGGSGGESPPTTPSSPQNIALTAEEVQVSICRSSVTNATS